MSATTVSSLNGMYKEVHGDLVDAVGEYGYLLDSVFKYRKGRKGGPLGDSFHEPVLLTNEHGITRGGSGAGNFALNGAISLNTKDAILDPYTYVMDSVMAFNAASRAQAAGKSAFADATAFVLERNMEGLAYYLSIACLYGQSSSGVGQVGTTGSGGGFTDLGGAGTSCTMQFTEASWASGIWSGSEGAVLEVADEGGAIETQGSDTEFTITGVDDANRTLTCTATAALIDQVATKNGSEALTVYFRDGLTKDFEGVDKIFSNTSGTIHQIDASQYTLWQGNAVSVGGNMTHTKLDQYIGQLVGRGLRKEDLTLLVAPKTWSSLNSELQAKRVLDSSYSPSKQKSGTNEIEYHSQNGKVTIVSEPMVKRGDGFLFPKKFVGRLGSADRDMAIPGADVEPFFQLEGSAGFGFRSYSDQALLVERPATCAKLSGITHT